MPGSQARLDDDLPRAASNLGWAALSTGDNRRLLLPDDRVMTIRAVETSPGTLEVQAMVTPFGDPRYERLLLDELARLMKAPPARAYGGRFELPPR